jgi:transcriptional coactivator HFI1/ADA1
MPDIGLAPWVSANDKPTTTTGSKPISGDAAERRLKGEVMQLPARDRRRIKELTQNEVRCYSLLRCSYQAINQLPFYYSMTPLRAWQICLRRRTGNRL